MPVTFNTSADGRSVNILVQGRFDFAVHREFRDAYRNQPSGVAYRVDLGRAEYMDSSALGMLLLLREHAGGDRAQISIERTPPNILKILEVANFGKLFKLG